MLPEGGPTEGWGNPAGVPFTLRVDFENGARARAFSKKYLGNT